MEGSVLGNTDFIFGKRQNHRFIVLNITVFTISINYTQRAFLVKYQLVIKSNLMSSSDKKVIVQIAQ